MLPMLHRDTQGTRAKNYQSGKDSWGKKSVKRQKEGGGMIGKIQGK